MKVFRALFALVMLAGWFNESDTLICGRPRGGHPGCPMHGPADAGTDRLFATEGHGTCHDAGTAGHCGPGQQCSMSVEALTPHSQVVHAKPMVRDVAVPAVPAWRSFHATPQGPPPKPSNRTA